MAWEHHRGRKRRRRGTVTIRRVLSCRANDSRRNARMANITEVPVTYKDAGGIALAGFVTFDAAKAGKRPGVVVLHEWWGITKHVRDEARYFASLGYTAFVADL